MSGIGQTVDLTATWEGKAFAVKATAVEIGVSGYPIWRIAIPEAGMNLGFEGRLSDLPAAILEISGAEASF